MALKGSGEDHCQIPCCGPPLQESHVWCLQVTLGPGMYFTNNTKIQLTTSKLLQIYWTRLETDNLLAKNGHFYWTVQSILGWLAVLSWKRFLKDGQYNKENWYRMDNVRFVSNLCPEMAKVGKFIDFIKNGPWIWYKRGIIIWPN